MGKRDERREHLSYSVAARTRQAVTSRNPLHGARNNHRSHTKSADLPKIARSQRQEEPSASTGRKRFFTDEQIREHLDQSRRAQGLPPTIEDTSVLDLIARILGPPRRAKGLSLDAGPACDRPCADERPPAQLAP